MSSKDDIQLETALSLALVSGWTADDKAHTFEASRREIRAVLADSKNRMAILNAMGFDTIVTRPDGSIVVYPQGVEA